MPVKVSVVPSSNPSFMTGDADRYRLKMCIRDRNMQNGFFIRIQDTHNVIQIGPGIKVIADIQRLEIVIPVQLLVICLLYTSSNLQRMLKAAGQKVPNMKPILEINPNHPIVQALKYENTRFDDWTNLLFDQAVLAEGGVLQDPAAFVKRMNSMLLESIGHKNGQ